MTRRPEAFRSSRARLLAGVLLLGLLGAAPLRAEGDPSPAPVPDTLIQALDGPLQVSLGAEALLDLPTGWRFVPAAALPRYFAGRPERPGAWDRGVVLTSAPDLELRLLFEPMGAVATEPLPQPDALLPQAQALARSLRQKPGGASQRELAFWRWEPTYDPAHQVLRFGGVWREGEDETVSLHLRWLARRGVLKLDWRGAEDNAAAFVALSEQLDEALHIVAGQALADAQPGEKRAALDLNGLVMDGLFGRRAASGGAPEAPARPLWAWIAVWAVGALAPVWAVVTLVQGLSAWLARRQKEQHEAQRLDYIGKKYGGRADEVEDVVDEGQEGYHDGN